MRDKTLRKSSIDAADFVFAGTDGITRADGRGDTAGLAVTECLLGFEVDKTGF